MKSSCNVSNTQNINDTVQIHLIFIHIKLKIYFLTGSCNKYGDSISVQLALVCGWSIPLNTETVRGMI